MIFEEKGCSEKPTAIIVRGFEILFSHYVIPTTTTTFLPLYLCISYFFASFLLFLLLFQSCGTEIVSMGFNGRYDDCFCWKNNSNFKIFARFNLVSIDISRIFPFCSSFSFSLPLPLFFNGISLHVTFVGYFKIGRRNICEWTIKISFLPIK